MKIDLNNSATQLNQNDWSAHKAAQSSGLAPQTGAEDRVTLTSAQDTVGSLTAQALNTPQVRQGKVDSLRQAIGNGSYQLDSAKIAAAIPADETD